MHFFRLRPTYRYTTCHPFFQCQLGHLHPSFARFLHHEEIPATSFVTGIMARPTSLVSRTSRSGSVASGWSSLRSRFISALSRRPWKRPLRWCTREVHACCLHHQPEWLWPRICSLTPCYTQEQGVNGVSCRSDVPGDDPKTALLHDSLPLPTPLLYAIDCIGEDGPSNAYSIIQVVDRSPM